MVVYIQLHQRPDSIQNLNRFSQSAFFRNGSFLLTNSFLGGGARHCGRLALFEMKFVLEATMLSLSMKDGIEF